MRVYLKSEFEKFHRIHVYTLIYVFAFSLSKIKNSCLVYSVSVCLGGVTVSGFRDLIPQIFALNYILES